ncbi:MAG: DUF2085 domain-containing protein [Anaerolineae bacterium]|nr:DUF2085 domain-containing protein [Anaerolineae bacterium]
MEPPSPSEGTVATAEVLAEVERRVAARRAASARGLQSWAGCLGRFLTRHWLMLCNGFFLFYAGLPILAPVLMKLGATRAGVIIYLVYSPLCHQLPQRSFFLFGPKLTYTLGELVPWLGPNAGINPATRAFVGNDIVGYKTALCQRDMAIYGTILLAGLLFGLVRRRWRIRPLKLWAYFVFGILPPFLDGGYQMLSYVIASLWVDGPIRPRESTPVLRVLTGGLFGLATAWLAYPLIEETMESVRVDKDASRQVDK